MESGVLLTIHGRLLGGRLVLRAVIFDYGMVLTGPPNIEAHAAMVHLTGLPIGEFERFYWADRHAYDEGKLTGITFWQKFLRDAGLPESAEMVSELNRHDARMWTTFDPALLDWQLRLKMRGLRTAILSNMGDSVLENMQREFDWLARFDVLVWSYQLGIAKPDPEIYRHTLRRLGAEPQETLFLDDKLVNIEAARSLGLIAIQFSTVARLRADISAAGLDGELPAL
jgi:putative hydrolase of the HAD superfamily